MEEVTVKVVCVQVEPVYKDPAATMAKVTKLLVPVISADVILLPEMAFPGYTFDNAEDIQPYLEEPNERFPTFRWCQSEAQRTHSYVVCGYPETAPDGLFNSQMVISPEGTLVTNYRKHFLYMLDKTWAQAGGEFSTVEIRIHGKKVRLGLGICMDINPCEFTAPFEDYELATHWKVSQADLMAFSTNWTSSRPDEDPKQLINYWALRLTPVLEDAHKAAFFLAADRVGSEKGTAFMGSSCIVQTRPPKLLASLDKTSEGLLQRSVVLTLCRET